MAKPYLALDRAIWPSVLCSTYTAVYTLFGLTLTHKRVRTFARQYYHDMSLRAYVTGGSNWQSGETDTDIKRNFGQNERMSWHFLSARFLGPEWKNELRSSCKVVTVQRGSNMRSLKKRSSLHVVGDPPQPFLVGLTPIQQ